MPPPSFPPLALRTGLVVAYQPLQRDDLPEPLLRRFRKVTAPASVCRDVILDGAHCRNLGAVADMKVVVDSHLGPQRHIVANRQAACQPDLGREQTVPADDDIVADLD